MEIINRKAKFDYYVESEIEAGIVLVGTEIKSLRKGSCDLKDTYVRIRNDEAYVINMYIAKYEEGNIFNHDERRERKLLLHKKEIRKLREMSQKDGYTLIPIKIYMNKNLAKITIGICKGKKNYDKREAIKERDNKKLEN
jgi:SsrA-binding protein